MHENWDHHGSVVSGVRDACKDTDQATAALLEDLKQRGLLEDTLVIWGGEFGRTPMVEVRGKDPGRDHHPQAFSIWLAGGGIRPGATIGQTDDFGFRAVENPVHVYDIQATILHCLGLDHERLTYFHAGRDFRLTDVHGRIVREILS
jgi:arylsulfatase A-like enzyme